MKVEVVCWWRIEVEIVGWFVWVDCVGFYCLVWCCFIWIVVVLLLYLVEEL